MTTVSDTPHGQREGRYWSKTRIGLSVVVIATVAMWVWIYLFAPRDNPDRLDTRSFATAAEAACAPLKAQIDELPAGNTATTPAERAIQVDQGTAITEEMVVALEREAALVTDESDLDILGRWFEDWHAYLDDRDAHAAKLEVAAADTPSRDLAFTLSLRGGGGQYTGRISGLANVNDMASCAVPGDL